MSHDTELQHLLSAVTDALLADDAVDMDTLVSQYQVPRSEVDSLTWVIRNLHQFLVGGQPSRRFVRRLKHDLMGAPNWNVVSRIRYLPPRVQIAAGIALVAGFMLLSRRRMIEDVKQEQEVPALQ